MLEVLAVPERTISPDGSDDDFDPTRFAVYLSGRLLNGFQVYPISFGEDPEEFHVSESSKPSGSDVYNLRLADISPKISKMSFGESYRVGTFDLVLHTALLESTDGEFAQMLCISPVPNFAEWTGPCTVGECVSLLKARCADEGLTYWADEIFGPDTGDGMTNFYFTETRPAATDESIGTTLSRFRSTVIALVQQVEDEAKAGTSQDSLTALFDFPVELRSACEQYLVYFAEFLRGLGLEAVAELKHQRGQTIFSITPVDGREALELIAEALGEFLEYPNGPTDSDTPSGSGGIELNKLRANILHLRSQLTLANAVLEAKDETIRALRFQTDRPVSDVNRLLPVAVQISNDSGSVEKFADGLVTLTQYEGNGFRVDVAEMYRRLRARFMDRKK